jgi:hypothetical protein
MLSDTEMQNLDREWITIRALWLILYVMLAMCLIIANVSNDHEEVSNLDTSNVLRYTVYGMALLSFIASYRIRQLMLMVEKGGFDRFVEVIPLYHIIKDRHDGAAQAVLARFVVYSILWGSLLAAIGSYGLVLRFAINDFLSLYILAGISAAFLYILRPRKAKLIEMVAHANRMA